MELEQPLHEPKTAIFSVRPTRLVVQGYVPKPVAWYYRNVCA